MDVAAVVAEPIVVVGWHTGNTGHHLGPGTLLLVVVNTQLEAVAVAVVACSLAGVVAEVEVVVAPIGLAGLDCTEGEANGAHQIVVAGHTAEVAHIVGVEGMVGTAAAAAAVVVLAIVDSHHCQTAVNSYLQGAGLLLPPDSLLHALSYQVAHPVALFASYNSHQPVASEQQWHLAKRYKIEYPRLNYQRSH